MDEGVGNILFYTSDGSLLNRLIATWTHSPYVHVAIQVSAIEKIEAGEHGIQLAHLDTPATLFDYQAHSPNVDEKDMAAALEWLHDKVGTPYGYGDFLSNANPFKKLFYFVRAKEYDCSALATEFLIKAGGLDLKGLEEDPHSVTPGDLAGVLHPV